MTMWFERTPGSLVARSTTDETAMLVGRPLPQWVRLPPSLGGSKVDIVSQKMECCPQCEASPEVRTLHLTNGLSVAECSPCGFVWFRKGSSYE